MEIYNEQVTDLLDPSSTNLLVHLVLAFDLQILYNGLQILSVFSHTILQLQLREDIKKGVYVENLSEFEVQTVADILKLLRQVADFSFHFKFVYIFTSYMSIK